MTVKPTMSVHSTEEIQNLTEKIRGITKMFQALLSIYIKEKVENTFKAKLRMEMSIWQTIRNQLHDYVAGKMVENHVCIESIKKKSSNVDVIFYRLEKAADSKHATD